MTKIKYSIEYQQSGGEGLRPIDDGEVVGIELEVDNGFALIPNVGDYVCIDKDPTGQRADFRGVVRYRSFYYRRTDDESASCHVNIVVQPSDIDTNLLIKE